MYEQVISVANLEATSPGIPVVTITVLHKDETTRAMSVITRLSSGASIPAHAHTEADETVYVLEGDFIEDGVSYGVGTVFYGKAMTQGTAPTEVRAGVQS